MTMMKRTLALVLLLGLVVVGLSKAEPFFVAISANQTAQSKSLPTWTQTVTIVAVSGSTCYFRLFTDVDTPGDATTVSAPLDPPDHLEFTVLPARSKGQGYPSGLRDSESYSPTGARARYYKSISVVCDTGQTASWRVYAK